MIRPSGTAAPVWCPLLALIRQAFAFALDHAGERPLADEHILLGMLSVPDSLASHVLHQVGVSLAGAEAIVGRPDH